MGADHGSIDDIGTQGLMVPAIGLGCMGMSEFYGPADEAAGLKVLDKALDLGCVFWDTADMYGPFTNEELLGRALEGVAIGSRWPRNSVSSGARTGPFWDSAARLIMSGRAARRPYGA
jgi:diketogulonate reductase-like aldo/keto reductase